jgi:hypothetical protein
MRGRKKEPAVAKERARTNCLRFTPGEHIPGGQQDWVVDSGILELADIFKEGVNVKVSGCIKKFNIELEKLRG